jgi:hypothetical protein
MIRAIRSVAHLLSALSSFLIGIILVIAPWWTEIWDANVLLQPWPILRNLVLSPFVRGGVTGLGLVNVLLAIVELREHLAER